jgi:energy-coupling factor transporter transmembrane protein EcfT
MQNLYKYKTFLYYFPADSFVWKINPLFKLFVYLFINIIVLISHFYLLNLFLSILILILLVLIGFFNYRKILFRTLTISLILFFLLSLFFQLLTYRNNGITTEELLTSIAFIFPFLSKWFLINMSGLFLLTTFSQRELICVLTKLKLNFKWLISIMVAFNMIGKLLESLDDINLALQSRGFKDKKIKNVFLKFRYIFSSMLIDNIEYISSLRATFMFNYEDIKEKYE